MVRKIKTDMEAEMEVKLETVKSPPCYDEESHEGI